ncbi:MAG: GatB/YqeY domain-containing protein [Clostridiaceae bacterium]|nr:GatB/YqeY domain-containing protein [Clostridiaceae bacterium]
MNVKETLFEDMKTAMRNKDMMRKEMLQILRAGILQVEKDQKIELDDAGVADIIAKEHKKRVENLNDLKDSGREDILEKNRAEILILEEYLPKQLSEQEITEIVDAAISQTEAKSARDMGKVMQVIMPQVKGKADGKLVNQIVKKQLG